MELSLVIACYNDGQHLEKNLCEIERTLSQTRYQYEWILIDDCSPDGSAQEVERAAQKRTNARWILHPQNVGRGGTVAEGMRMAHGDYVGYLDIDLEVHSRYIPSMLLELESGYDGAVAHRIYRINWNFDTFIRNILSVSYRKLVARLLHLPYRDTETGYKFFKRESILPILQQARSPGWFWDTEIMALSFYAGLKIQEVPAAFIRKWEKASTVKPFRDSVIYLRELLRFRRRMKQEGRL